MKTSKVYFRIPNSMTITSTVEPEAKQYTYQNWYCIEYPAFNTMQDMELGVLRAKSMLGLHKAASRIFYIDSAPTRRYISIKTDGLYEFPSPSELREMKSYTPEDLASFLDIKPLETL